MDKIVTAAAQVMIGLKIGIVSALAKDPGCLNEGSSCGSVATGKKCSLTPGTKEVSPVLGCHWQSQTAGNPVMGAIG